MGQQQTVAFAASGGLSPFVVDEELDRLALKGMAEASGDLLSALPRVRLQSATTEILNLGVGRRCDGRHKDGPRLLRTRLPYTCRDWLRLRRRDLAGVGHRSGVGGAG